VWRIPAHLAVAPSIANIFSNARHNSKNSHPHFFLAMAKRKVGALEKVEADLTNLQNKLRRDPL